MKKILKNLKIGSFIGIYIFEEEIFSIGKILNISKDYLYLENYDINGEIIGIKIFLINSIRRIILSSKYINRLKEKGINLSAKEFLALAYKNIKDTRVNSYILAVARVMNNVERGKK